LSGFEQRAMAEDAVQERAAPDTVGVIFRAGLTWPREPTGLNVGACAVDASR